MGETKAPNYAHDQRKMNNIKARAEIAFKLK